MSQHRPLLLEVRRAMKKFGAVRALNDVSIKLYKNEVLALLGDNGAGKSTLVKALSGVHSLDAGDIFLDGQSVSLRSSAEARLLGIETVYQDLSLFDNLNVTQNFFAGREARRWPWLGPLSPLSDREMEKSADDLLRSLEVRLPANRTSLIGLMSGGQRQAVAVARAAAFASKLIILDEPTAALGIRESRNVLVLVRKLKERGVSVVLISHNMEEVMAVADRAVVLRQGRYIGEAAPTPENQAKLVAMIVGAAPSV